MYTVNTLLQKLNYVKQFQYYVVKEKKSILFASFVKNSEQYLGYYAKYSCLFNLKGYNSEVTKYGI